jgi:type II pantothenate kinase
MCKRFAKVNSFEEVRELCKKGDLSKIDLRISDVSKEEIPTLPRDITAANFGKFEENATRADILLGIINTVFETIAMLAVFATRNDDIKDVVLIGNVVSLPIVKDIIDKIQKLYNIKFIIPENPEYAVALGAIIASIK